MFKRIFINIILILLVFIGMEYWSFLKEKEVNLTFKTKADRLEANKTRDFQTKYNILNDFNPTVWRISYYQNPKTKNSVIWFGCSFAEGAGLEDDHTPCYKISKLTGKNCINRSKGATGTQFIYYQLSNPEFFEKAPDADYVIYVFIWDHLQRLYNYQVNPLINMFNLRYKIKNNELAEIKPVFKPLYSLYSIKRFLNRKVMFQKLNEEKNFRLFNKIMSESARIIKRHYPDSQFIMLEFPDNTNRDLPQEEIDKLKSYGINVVRVKDLTSDINIQDRKYWLSDDIHPSEELWDIILPRLVKKNLSE